MLSRTATSNPGECRIPGTGKNSRTAASGPGTGDRQALKHSLQSVIPYCILRLVKERPGRGKERPRSRPRFRPEEKEALPADAVSGEVGGYSLRGRIWIARGEETFLGYGRVVLLERIREYGSISEAARSMEMSYRHAWELVDSMNRQAPFPLVDTSTGGVGGGGARLTPYGEAAIRLFWELYRDYKRYIRSQERKLSRLQAGGGKGVAARGEPDPGKSVAESEEAAAREEAGNEPNPREWAPGGGGWG